MPRFTAFIVLVSVFLFAFTLSFSQGIQVASFERLPNDMDARVNAAVIDQNGDKCALIKVVTDQKGLVWEGGMLGITKVKNKTGEYWVYVPRGSKKITIKHEDLGVLRDYRYPQSIDEATVYEMVLKTDASQKREGQQISAQWLVIETRPDSAKVFVNGNLVGATPFQRKFKEGSHTYRLEKSGYHARAGRIELEGQKTELDLTLKPNFGHLRVTSEPESGMQIYLDERNTGKKTPATLRKLPSGKHQVQLQSQWYQPANKQVTIQDGQTGEVHFSPDAAFARVTIETQPQAGIYIDGRRKARGKWEGRLLEGIYTVKGKKERYLSQTKQLEVKAGQSRQISLHLKGKKGAADIITSPMKATVYLDDQKKGQSPLSLNNLLVGDYSLRLEKQGYGTVQKNLSIRHDTTITIEQKLPQKREIRLSSNPEGAKILINNQHRGSTPTRLTLPYGQHQVKLVYQGSEEKAQINVQEEGKNDFEIELSSHREALVQKGNRYFSEEKWEKARKYYKKAQDISWSEEMWDKIATCEDKMNQEEEQDPYQTNTASRSSGSGDKSQTANYLMYSYDQNSPLGFSLGRLHKDNVSLYMKAKMNKEIFNNTGNTVDDYNETTGETKKGNLSISAGFTFKLFHPIWANIGGGIGFHNTYEEVIEYDGTTTGYALDQEASDHFYFPEVGLNMQISNAIILKYGVMYHNGPIHQMGIGINLGSDMNHPLLLLTALFGGV